MKRPRTLLTGATGLLGRAVLAERLRRGERCLAVVRTDRRSGAERLRTALAAIDIDLDALPRDRRPEVLEADLADGVELPGGIDRIIHVAGSTRFDAADDGEPGRSNVTGTERLLEAAAAVGVRELHHVSTAYVGGPASADAPEAPLAAGVPARNDYERSKQRAEALVRDWARREQADLTIHRPSIIVGEHATGRTAKFDGLYAVFRAIDAVSRRTDEETAAGVPLGVPGQADDRHNIVPVDWVAAMIAAIVDRRGAHGRVHHLVHPDPPTAGALAAILERELGNRPVRFDGAVAPGVDPFLDSIRTLLPYFGPEPRFARAHTAAVERAACLPCPTWDHAAVARLIEFGASRRWRIDRPLRPDDDRCAAYFHGFLPDRIERSIVARVHGLHATVRFVIDDVPDGQWVCRFEQGRLVDLRRGANGLVEDFTYCTDERSFMRVVGALEDPQSAYLDGRVEIRGDLERALVMGMIFHEFSREHPFPAASIGLETGRAS